MKKCNLFRWITIWGIWLMVLSPTSIVAQVINDICQQATNIDNLESNVTTCISTTNIAANGELPYIHQTNCLNEVAMPFPAADVWYSFTAIGNLLDITVTSDLQNVVVALYEGSCANLIGRECEVNLTDGNLTTTFAPVAPGETYYLQVSGGNMADMGAIELCLKNYELLTDICILGQTLAVNPSPTLNTYGLGENITICLTIEGYEENASDWFHGLVPVFGEGWDTSGLTPTSPNSCDGDGNWAWYESVTGIGENNVGPQGPGFFYDSFSNAEGTPIDEDPSNNYGDFSSGADCGWEFCLSLSTKATCPNTPEEADLSIQFLNFSDSETGSWTPTGDTPCPEDPVFVFKAILSCCSSPEITNIVQPTTTTPAIGEITAVGSGQAPFNFQWSTGLQEVSTNSSTVTGLTEGFYIVTVTDNENCSNQVSITLLESVDTTGIDIPISVQACGECIASPEMPISVFLQNDVTQITTEYVLDDCVDIISADLEDGIYSIRYNDIVGVISVENGLLNSSDTLVLNRITLSDPGTFANPLTPVIICAGEETNLTTEGANILVSDQLVYILHTEADNITGSIVAINPTSGNFSLNSNNIITANRQYYISAMTGPVNPITNLPDTTQACLRTVLGPPVVFLLPIELSIDEFCENGSGDFIITASVLGGYPQYDTLATYDVLGDINGTFKFGEIFQKTYAQNSGVNTYTLSASDEFCAETATVDNGYTCLKTPIELLSFTGEIQATGNLLKWTTATEINNAYFTVEKSTDGITFEPVSVIEGAGNSMQLLQYQWMDKFLTSGLNYYRLVQTDFDGQQTTSNVIVLQRGESDLAVTNVFPIPTTRNVSIMINTVANLSVKVYTTTGQLMTAKQLQQTNEINLDLTNYNSDIYFAVISDGKNVMVEKIVRK